MKWLLILGLLSSSLYGATSRWKFDDFSTHQPILHTIAQNTTGPIIEFGCGNGSTDLLHEVCKQNKRLLVSVDDNLEWLNIFKEKYKHDSEWHKFIFVPGSTQNEDASHWIKFLNESELFKDIQFEVCFVDQSPWQGRVESILHLKDKVRFIILHDCDYFPEKELLGTTIRSIDNYNQIPGDYNFSKTFSAFKVFFPPKPWPGQSGPPTLLGSNFEKSLPDIDYNCY